jgi:hypothetical protein
MIKLIKEFLQSGIQANKSITEAMNASSQANKKAVHYYDTIIYNDNLRVEMDQLRFQSSSINTPSTNEVPFYETCSCNPKNGGSGVCGCTMANQMVKK